ncbi:MAG: XRE family transcriptional regulator [Proteobacteria bacterium]|nr:XRE family transcriptional regulator [Pseudomonadota bacterium]
MGRTGDVDVMALEIGGKIKELRKKKGYTLQDVSSITGLSRPLISQIENNRVVPPVATLLRLARSLGVGLSHFFQEDDTRERVVVTRKDERRSPAKRPHHQKGVVPYMYEALEVKKASKHMEPFYVTFDEIAAGDMSFFSHEGEEFVYLLSGRLEFRTHDQVYLLETGDSLYFESDLAHAFRSLGPGPSQAIIVIYHKD